MSITPTNPFKGRQYPGEVILLGGTLVSPVSTCISARLGDSD
jgi:hypothetical protein